MVNNKKINNFSFKLFLLLLSAVSLTFAFVQCFKMPYHLLQLLYCMLKKSNRNICFFPEKLYIFYSVLLHHALAFFLGLFYTDMQAVHHQLREVYSQLVTLSSNQVYFISHMQRCHFGKLFVKKMSYICFHTHIL